MSKIASARRRDFGRRRALGARRSNLVLLIVGHILLASLLGSVAGSAAGSVVVRTMTDQPVDLAYPTAVATLMVLTSTVAGLGPAVVAALRDPLAVLRSA
jgi:putative ABC transport system permease protein